MIWFSRRIFALFSCRHLAAGGEDSALHGETCERLGRLRQRELPKIAADRLARFGKQRLAGLETESE